MALRAVVCAFVVVASTISVEGYSTGAPSHPDICSQMKPKHGKTESQPLPPPYDFSISSASVKSGDRVTVTIKQSGSSAPFKGFLLQARKVGGDKPEGKFVPVNGKSKGVTCGGVENSSLTHVSNDEKTELMAEWIAPGPGSYEI